jgi:uncharacterized protein YjbI with pentapeptide repeats
METIRNCCFEGERPLFASSDLRLENVQFYPGDSALKESQHIAAVDCLFMGRYPFWHTERTRLSNCHFTAASRDALWYASEVRVVDTVVEAPRMFRQVRQLHLENSRLTNAAECGWNCRDVVFHQVELRGGDYLLLNSQYIDLEGCRLQGNYALQDTREVVVRDTTIESNDAFWNTENVTIYDSVLVGECLGWHSKNLRLVNCTIHGTQPLCYAKNLVLENCTLVETDRCFEYSTLQAQINGDILSVKNPTSGRITARSIGELILDEHCLDPGACRIITADAVIC